MHRVIVGLITICVSALVFSTMAFAQGRGGARPQFHRGGFGHRMSAPRFNFQNRGHMAPMRQNFGRYGAAQHFNRGNRGYMAQGRNAYGGHYGRYQQHPYQNRQHMGRGYYGRGHYGPYQQGRNWNRGHMAQRYHHYGPYRQQQFRHRHPYQRGPWNHRYGHQGQQNWGRHGMAQAQGRHENDRRYDAR